MPTKETARLEAFSDGVFAVAVTLLALEIGIPAFPGATNAALWRAVVERWPDYVACVNSFAVVLLIWVGHHRIVQPVRALDTRATFLNGLVLLLVTLFPFPTRTVGRFLGTGAAPAAVAFYAGYTGVLTGAMLLLTLYLRRRPWLLVDAGRGEAVLAGLLRRQVVAVAAYALLTGLAFVAARLALAGTVAMWVFWGIAVAAADESRPTP